MIKGRAAWAGRLMAVAQAHKISDDGVKVMLFPAGKLDTNDDGELIFTGTNRKAHRAAARSTQKRGSPKGTVNRGRKEASTKK